MAIIKRCAASGRALQACSERNITCENTIVVNFAKSKQINAPKTICSDEFATPSSTDKVAQLIENLNDKKTIKSNDVETRFIKYS